MDGSVSHCRFFSIDTRLSVQGGLTVRVEDTNSFPFTVWGKAGRSVHGWDVSTRLESSSSDLSSVGIDIAASGDSTSVLLKGGADTSAPALAVNSLGLTQRLSGLGGSWTVAPRYNVDARKPDIRVVYGTEDTVVAVDAAPDKQKITISQRLGADNTITPSVSSAGELELEYRHDLGDGSLTASFKPDDSFQLGWSDGEWQANFKAPVQGLYRFNSGVQMNIRRTVDLTGMGAAPGITGGAGDG